MSWVAAGVGAAGLIAGGASALTKDKPQGRRASIRATAQGTVRGYQDTSPLSLALNQLYNPSYLALGGQNLQGLLFGSPERSYSTSVPNAYNNRGQPIGENRTVSGTIPGSTGLIDTITQAQRRLSESNLSLNDRYRQSQLDQAQKYLPQAQALDEAANPEQVALRRSLAARAQEQLSLGDRVNPELARNWQDQNTSRYANMGFRPNEGFVQTDDFLKYTGGAQALQGQRQQFAGETLDRLSSTQPSYVQFLLGMNDPSGQQGLGLTTGQQPLTYTGNMFDPYNPNTTSLSNQAAGYNFAGDQNQNQATAGLAQGGTDFLSSLLNSYSGKTSP